MQNKKQIVVSSLIVVILVGLAGLYIYNDINKKEETPPTPSPVTNTDIQATGDYTIKEIPIEKSTSKIPNLDRPLIFNSDLSPEAKKIVTNNIKRLSDNLKKDSSQWNEWLELGIQYKIAGDYEGAQEAWEYAAVLAPESYVPWNNLGDLYANYLKDYPKAEESIKKAVTLKTDYIAGYRALYELYHYSYKEKANLAPQILKEGLSKNPKSTDLMVLLAQYYKEIGDKDNARIYYQKALAEAKIQGNASLATLIEQEIANL